MRRRDGEERVMARRRREDRRMTDGRRSERRNWRKTRPVGCPEGRREGMCSGLGLGKEDARPEPSKRELHDAAIDAQTELKVDAALDALVRCEPCNGTGAILIMPAGDEIDCFACDGTGYADADLLPPGHLELVAELLARLPRDETPDPDDLPPAF